MQILCSVPRIQWNGWISQLFELFTLIVLIYLVSVPTATLVDVNRPALIAHRFVNFFCTRFVYPGFCNSGIYSNQPFFFKWKIALRNVNYYLFMNQNDSFNSTCFYAKYFHVLFNESERTSRSSLYEWKWHQKHRWRSWSSMSLSH